MSTQRTKQVRQSPKAPKQKKAPNFNQSKIFKSQNVRWKNNVNGDSNKNQNLLTQLLWKMYSFCHNLFVLFEKSNFLRGT